MVKIEVLGRPTDQLLALLQICRLEWDEEALHRAINVLESI